MAKTSRRLALALVLGLVGTGFTRAEVVSGAEGATGGDMYGSDEVATYEDGASDTGVVGGVDPSFVAEVADDSLATLMQGPDENGSFFGGWGDAGSASPTPEPVAVDEELLAVDSGESAPVDEVASVAGEAADAEAFPTGLTGLGAIALPVGPDEVEPTGTPYASAASGPTGSDELTPEEIAGALGRGTSDANESITLRDGDQLAWADKSNPLPFSPSEAKDLSTEVEYHGSGLAETGQRAVDAGLNGLGRVYRGGVEAGRPMHETIVPLVRDNFVEIDRSVSKEFQKAKTPLELQAARITAAQNPDVKRKEQVIYGAMSTLARVEAELKNPSLDTHRRELLTEEKLRAEIDLHEAKGETDKLEKLYRAYGPLRRKLRDFLEPYQIPYSMKSDRLKELHGTGEGH